MKENTVSSDTKNQDDTKERLLDAALDLFAMNGYAEVSVRQITARAGTHLSAVNYHFGDKRNLYLEVFRSRWLPRAQRIRRSLEQASAQGSLEPSELIRLLAKGFITGFPSYNEAIRFHQLIAREMAQPGEAYDFIFEKAQSPLFEFLINQLTPQLPSEVGREQAALHIFSIFAQMLQFNFGRRLVSRVIGSEYNEEFIDHVVEHIVSFSMKGMGLPYDQKTKAV